ncbi:MAG: DsbA family protein [Myxococcota bacterium]|nr:DsbA family protein [Myxococcota bacterium]
MTLIVALLLGCQSAPSEPGTPTTIEPIASKRSTPAGDIAVDQDRMADGRLQLKPGTLQTLPAELAEGLEPDQAQKLLQALNQSYGACASCILEGISASDCLATCPVQTRVARYAGGLIAQGSSDAEVLESLRFTEGWVDLPELGGPAETGEGPVLLVVTDYESPFCGQSWAHAIQLQAEFPSLRLQPLFWAPERHVQSDVAARGVLAAASQGKWKEMHQALLVSQEVDRTVVLQAAEQIGLDMGRFRGDLFNQGELLEAHQQAAESAGVRGDPAFFLDGWRLRGLPESQIVSELIALQQAP